MGWTGVRVVLLAAFVVLAVGLGLWRRQADGRVRPVEGQVLNAADLGFALGRLATLVQFSTATCTPCRQARRVLARVAERTPGVALVEVDADERLDLARELRVHRTPTVLVLDSLGTVVSRFSGVPSEDQVEVALRSGTGRIVGGAGG